MKTILTLIAICLSLPSTASAQSLQRAPDGALQQQWQWALGEISQGFREAAWIGFSFPRLMRPGHYVFSGGMWIRYGGRRTTEGAPLQDWLATGGDFADLERRTVTVGGASPEGDVVVERQIAILLLVPPTAGATIERSRLQDVALPLQPEGRSLIWLGRRQPEESFEFLSDLYTRSPAEGVREDIVLAVGLLEVPDRSLDFLDSVLSRDDSERVRDEAASALQYFPTSRSVSLLVRSIEQDVSERVRREAVESLGDLDLESAETALIEVATSSESIRLRREAAECLGGRRSARAAEALQRIAFEDAAERVQREAVEAIGDLPPELAFPALERVLQSHPSDRVRREALETISDWQSSPRAVAAITAALKDDRSESVQREAVESIASLPVEVSLPTLIEVAENHASRRVRREAFEQLAETASRQASATLEAIASDATDDLYRYALSALLEMPDGVVNVIEIARSHPNLRVRKRALRELGDSDDPRARAALLEIARESLRPDY